MAGGLDKAISEGLFQPKVFYDSVLLYIRCIFVFVRSRIIHVAQKNPLVPCK